MREPEKPLTEPPPIKKKNKYGILPKNTLILNAGFITDLSPSPHQFHFYGTPSSLVQDPIMVASNSDQIRTKFGLNSDQIRT